MRLINADALKHVIYDHAYLVQDFCKTIGYGMFWIGGIEKAIDNAPTIDAVPVRHGKWLHPEEDDEDYGSVSCSCSVCGWKFYLYEDDIDGTPYCPMCGAKMEPVAPWYQVEGVVEGGRKQLMEEDNE